MRRSSAAIDKGLAPAARPAQGTPPNPGLCAVVEVLRGHRGGPIDLYVVGKGLPGERGAAEDALPGLRQVQPAGPGGDEAARRADSRPADGPRRSDRADALTPRGRSRRPSNPASKRASQARTVLGWQPSSAAISGTRRPSRRGRKSTAVEERRTGRVLSCGRVERRRAGADGEGRTVIADKGDDAAARVPAPLRAAGKVAVIPPKRNWTAQRAYDRDLYAARHLVENRFCALKQFRAIATRDDQTARSFLAAFYLAATAITLN
jgi:transposase